MKLSALTCQIRNFRGINSATFPINQHALIAGQNGSGKTSIAMAIAIAATANAAPFEGVKKADARKMLRDGESRGVVGIRLGEGKDDFMAVNFPGGSVSGGAAGTELATPIALGLTSVATMKAAESSKILAEYIGAAPTRDDMVAVVGEAITAKLWPRIEVEGFDAVLASVKETGSRLKGQWEGITGEAFGSKKARGWKPQGSESVDMSQSATAMQEAVQEAAQKVQTLLSSKAVSGEKIRALREMAEKGTAAAQWLEKNSIALDKKAIQNRIAELQRHAKEAQQVAYQVARATALQETASKLDSLQNEFVETGKRKSELTAKLESLIAEKNGLPKPMEQVVTAPCPSCGTHLIVVSRSELKEQTGETVPDAENQARATKINSISAEIAKAKAELNGVAEKELMLPREIAAAKDAKKELEENCLGTLEVEDIGKITAEIQHLSVEVIPRIQVALEGKQAEIDADALAQVGGSSEEEIAEAQHAHDDAVFALGAKTAYDKAAQLAKQIATTAKVVEVLAPGGLRQEVLSRALDSFNSQLAEISSAARWKAVKITDKMTVNYGDREFGWQLSESEKFRVKVVLQMAMAKIDKSKFIVIDAADILDRDGRNGLMLLVKGSDIPVITTMTINKREDMPNVGRIGVSGYWIENGELVAV